jgi:hypothetical protein
MTPEVFAHGMGLLQQAYPAREVTEKTLRLYGQMLADLTDDEFEVGVKTHLTRGKFFPAISELREAARPTPTVADVTPLFARAELLACLGKSPEAIEREIGPVAMLAMNSAGGVISFRRLDEPNARAFALKQFTAAMVEHHQDTGLVAITGQAPDRLKSLVGSVGTPLRLTGGNTSRRGS